MRHDEFGNGERLVPSEAEGSRTMNALQGIALWMGLVAVLGIF